MTAAERRERREKALHQLRAVQREMAGRGHDVSQIIADLEATDEPEESPADRALRVIREASDETRERWRGQVLGGDVLSDMLSVAADTRRLAVSNYIDGAANRPFALTGAQWNNTLDFHHEIGGGQEIAPVSDDLIAELFKLFPEATGTAKPKPKGPWRPGDGERYYYRNEEGDVGACKWGYGLQCEADALAATGNIFPTADRCEADGKWRDHQSHMLSCAVEAWEEVEVRPDGDYCGYYRMAATGGVIGGCHAVGKIFGAGISNLGTLLFPTEESARAARGSAKAAGLWIWDEVAG